MSKSLIPLYKDEMFDMEISDKDAQLLNELAKGKTTGLKEKNLRMFLPDSMSQLTQAFCELTGDLSYFMERVINKRCDWLVTDNELLSKYVSSRKLKRLSSRKKKKEANKIRSMLRSQYYAQNLI